MADRRGDDDGDEDASFEVPLGESDPDGESLSSDRPYAHDAAVVDTSSSEELAPVAEPRARRRAAAAAFEALAVARGFEVMTPPGSAHVAVRAVYAPPPCWTCGRQPLMCACARDAYPGVQRATLEAFDRSSSQRLPTLAPPGDALCHDLMHRWLKRGPAPYDHCSPMSPATCLVLDGRGSEHWRRSMTRAQVPSGPRVSDDDYAEACAYEACPPCALQTALRRCFGYALYVKPFRALVFSLHHERALAALPLGSGDSRVAAVPLNGRRLCAWVRDQGLEPLVLFTGLGGGTLALDGVELMPHECGFLDEFLKVQRDPYTTARFSLRMFNACAVEAFGAERMAELLVDAREGSIFIPRRGTPPSNAEVHASGASTVAGVIADDFFGVDVLEGSRALLFRRCSMARRAIDVRYWCAPGSIARIAFTDDADEAAVEALTTCLPDLPRASRAHARLRVRELSEARPDLRRRQQPTERLLEFVDLLAGSAAALPGEPQTDLERALLESIETAAPRGFTRGDIVARDLLPARPAEKKRPPETARAAVFDCTVCRSETDKLRACLPCGHACACDGCAESLLTAPNGRKCPVCRGEIRGLVPLSLPPLAEPETPAAKRPATEPPAAAREVSGSVARPSGRGRTRGK